MKYRNEALLLLGALVCGLGLVEVSLRILGLPAQPITLAQAGARAGTPLDPAAARPYADAVPLAPGTVREWFLESPPPLAERTDPRPGIQERYQEYDRRGLFPPQAEYVWNTYYVEAERCKTDNRFRGFPAQVEVFTPARLTPFPRYRFPAGVTTVSGLVTNQFGLRGHAIGGAKPARTVRIAFLGASTTAGFHYFAYSYPEYVEHWLNRWSEANSLNVKFEALNGGREAIGATESAAILEQELLPLDPDMAVFYPSANDFILEPERYLSPPIPRRSELDSKDTAVQTRLPQGLRDHFATARLLELSLNNFQTAGEPRKPSYKILWPARVSESNPDPDSPDLPLSLPEVVRGLDSMDRSMKAAGGRLLVCSCKWLPGGFALSPKRHQTLYRPYNTVLWPLRYRDILRLADFQNRVLHNYATTRNVDYFDVAAALPDDANLFLDALHLSETGLRLKAWTMFQHLVPILKREIDSGHLPRPAGAHLPALPKMDTAVKGLTCGPSDPAAAVVAAEIPLGELRANRDVGKVVQGMPAQLIASPMLWAEIARAPLRDIPADRGVPYVRIRGRVVRGQIGIGWMNAAGEVENEIRVVASKEAGDHFLPVIAPDRARELEFRNTSRSGESSEMLVEKIELLAGPAIGR